MKRRVQQKQNKRYSSELRKRIRRLNGSHERWIRLGRFAAEHRRSFDPALDGPKIGHLTGVVFFRSGPSFFPSGDIGIEDVRDAPRMLATREPRPLEQVDEKRAPIMRLERQLPGLAAWPRMDIRVKKL